MLFSRSRVPRKHLTFLTSPTVLALFGDSGSGSGSDRLGSGGSDSGCLSHGLGHGLGVAPLAAAGNAG